MRCRPHHLANIPQSCGAHPIARCTVRVLLAQIAQQVGDEGWVAAECLQGTVGEQRRFGFRRSLPEGCREGMDASREPGRVACQPAQISSVPFGLASAPGAGEREVTPRPSPRTGSGSPWRDVANLLVSSRCSVAYKAPTGSRARFVRRIASDGGPYASSLSRATAAMVSSSAQGCCRHYSQFGTIQRHKFLQTPLEGSCELIFDAGHDPLRWLLVSLLRIGNQASTENPASCGEATEPRRRGRFKPRKPFRQQRNRMHRACRTRSRVIRRKEPSAEQFAEELGRQGWRPPGKGRPCAEHASNPEAKARTPSCAPCLMKTVATARRVP